jgi:hypothetical protein
MVRSGEPATEDEFHDHMNIIFPLIDSLHSIYIDDISFVESIENGVLYSVILLGSGNIIGGKSVLIRNFESHLKKALKDVRIKLALGHSKYK